MEPSKDPMTQTNGRAEAFLDDKWVPGEVIFKRHKDKHYLFKADTSILEHIWIPCDKVRPSKMSNKVKETFKWKRHRGNSNVGEIYESSRKIYIDSQWSTFSNEDAILSKGAAVYEVKFLDGSKRHDCYPQIGWANEKFEKRDPGGNSGCGDCENSWAVDGHRVQKWHAKSEPWGVRWKSNSVISLVVDMEKKEFHVGIDGAFFHPLGKCFDHLHWDKGLYPCLSGKNMSLSIRMYPHEQKYPLKKIAPLYQSVAANIIMLIQQCYSWKEYAYDVNESTYLPSKEDIEIWRQYHEFDFLYDKLLKLKHHEPSVLLANCISRRLFKKASELFDLFNFEQLISHPFLKSGHLFADDILNLATDEAEYFVDIFFKHLQSKELGLDALKTLARGTFKNSGEFSTKLFTFFLNTCAAEVKQEFTHWFLNKLDDGIITQHWDEVQREGDDTCLILSSLLRDVIAQLEKISSEMTTLDRFTGAEKLSSKVLDFIKQEFKKSRSTGKDILKSKFKSMNEDEITKKMEDIIAAGDAAKQEIARIIAMKPSKRTAAFNSGVFGTVPFPCFSEFVPDKKEVTFSEFVSDEKGVTFAKETSEEPVTGSGRATASFNTGVFGSVPRKALEVVKRATASYNTGVFGFVSASSIYVPTAVLTPSSNSNTGNSVSTASYNSGVFGAIGKWCLDPESAKSREKLKRPDKPKKKKKKVKKVESKPVVQSYVPSRRYGRRPRGRARYRNRPREPKSSIPIYAPSSFGGGSAALFTTIEKLEEIKSKRSVYPEDFVAYYKERFKSDPQATLKEIESLGYITERAKEGFNLIKIFSNVIRAIYAVGSNAKRSYNLYFTLPTEKDFDAALSSGFVPCTMQKIKKALDFLWPREMAFRNYSLLLSGDVSSVKELLKDVQLKELSHLTSRPNLINDILHAKLQQVLGEPPGEVKFDHWPEMMTVLCEQMKSEIGDEESPYSWFSSDTRHDDYILTECGDEYPELAEAFNTCFMIIKQARSSLAVVPFFDYLENQDEVSLYNLLREVSFADLMSLEEVRKQEPLRISIENFLKANPEPKPAHGQVTARFEMGATWYKGTQIETTEDDKILVQFSHGDQSSIYKHQVRSHVGSQHDSDKKQIFMEEEQVELTIPNASGKTNGMWYEGKVLSVLDDTGEYEIELMLPKHLCKSEEELAAERAAAFKWPTELNVTIGLRMLRFRHVPQLKGEEHAALYMCCDPEELTMQKLQKKDKERNVAGEWDFMGDTAVFKEGGICTFPKFGNGVWTQVNYDEKATKKSKQRWQFWESSGWLDYSEDLNQILRDAGGVGVHRYAAPNGHEYEVDLDAMIQRNVHSGYERQIRLYNASGSDAQLRRQMPEWFQRLPQDAHVVLREAAALAGPNMPPDANLLFTMQYGLTNDQIKELMDYYYKKPDETQLMDTWDDEPDDEIVAVDDFVLGEKYAVKHKTAMHKKNQVDTLKSLKKWMKVPYCQIGTLVSINDDDKCIVLRVDGKECCVPCNLVKRAYPTDQEQPLVKKVLKIAKRYVRAIDPNRVVPRDIEGNPMLCAIGESEQCDDSITCKWCMRGHITKVDPYFHFSSEDPSEVLCYSCYNYSTELLPLHLREYGNSRLLELPYRSFWVQSKPVPDQILCFHPWPMNHLRNLMEDNLYSVLESPLDFEFENTETKLCEQIIKEFNNLKARELSCRFVHFFQECSEKALEILPQITILQLSELGHKDIGKLMNDTLLNAFSQWQYSMNKAKRISQPHVTLRISKATDMNLRQVEAFRTDMEPFILRVYEYASNVSDSVESSYPAETLTDGKLGRVVYCKPLLSGKNFVEFEILHCKHPKEIGYFRINADGKHEGICVEILENGVVLSEHVMTPDTDTIATPVQVCSKPIDLQAFFDSIGSAQVGDKWSEKLIATLTTLFDALQNKLKDEVQNCDSLEQLEAYQIDWLEKPIKVKEASHEKMLTIIRSILGTLSILNATKDMETLNRKAMERILNRNFNFNKKKSEADWMNFLQAVFKDPERDTLFLSLYCEPESVEICRALFNRLKISFDDPVDFSVVPPMIQRVSSIIQEEKKRRNLLKDVKATKAAATQHVILTHMAKNLDIRSLSILMKKNVEGFGLQSPDGPDQSCIAALIQAYFFEKGPKPPENYFKKLCEEIIERMISLEMWQELLHVTSKLETKTDLPAWITSKVNLINAINTIWSKVHFLQRQAIHEFLSADTAHKVSCPKDVLNLLNDLDHQEVICENVRSILSLQPGDRLDALERIGVSNDNDDDDFCNICYQLPKDTELSCKHWLCSGCFLRIQSSPEPFCPFCRTPFQI